MVRLNEEHVVRSLQSLEYMSKLAVPDVVKVLCDHNMIWKTDDRKLAVFDLDETLIHTLYKRNKDNADRQEQNIVYDARVPVKNSDGSVRYLFINIRPFMIEVLSKLKRWYRIAVFTASLKTYADAILDFLDPLNKIFEGRYYRSECHVTNDNVYIKDLRIFTNKANNSKAWDMEDIVIIDNASHSFGFQIENGIPMLPFYNDKEDKEMVYLYHYLKSLDDIQVFFQLYMAKHLNRSKVT
jgi:CTD small phosphatase-like protein 2